MNVPSRALLRQGWRFAVCDRRQFADPMTRDRTGSHQLNQPSAPVPKHWQAVNAVLVVKQPASSRLAQKVLALAALTLVAGLEHRMQSETGSTDNSTGATQPTGCKYRYLVSMYLLAAENFTAEEGSSQQLPSIRTVSDHLRPSAPRKLWNLERQLFRAPQRLVQRSFAWCQLCAQGAPQGHGARG
jgi:hypothetical protein